MCGRFVASRPIEDLIDEFEVDDVRVPEERLPEPRYNISPQADVVAIRDVERRLEEGGELVRRRRLGVFRWGLVPSWAKDPGSGARTFNARAETLADKPMYRTALSKRRCIVPADAFYEWQPIGSGTGRSRRKQPWLFRRADGASLAFAGLYEVWKARDDSRTGTQADGSPSGAWDRDWLLTCSIVTTRANELMVPIHDRMPVVLEQADIETWLAPAELGAAELGSLLEPPREDVLVCFEVGPEVGNSRSEGPELIVPLSELGTGGGEAGSDVGGDTGGRAGTDGGGDPEAAHPDGRLF